MRVSVRVSSAAVPLYTPQLFVQRLRIHFEWWLQVILPWVAATSRAMSKPKEFYFQIDDCVYPCSRSSIKNANLWADTEDEVKMAYQLHLDKSSYHAKLTEEQKKWAMSQVQIYKRPWPKYQDQGSAKKRACDDWSKEGGGESGTFSSGGSSGLRPEDGAAAVLRMSSPAAAALRERVETAERKRKKEEDDAHMRALANAAAEKKRKREEDEAEKKRKREEDEARQASAEEEVITVSTRDLVFVLRTSRRAIEAARKCGDFLEKGLLAFRSQEAIFFEAKGAVERMLKK